VDLFAIKHIVAEVTNDATEISLTEAQTLYGEEAEVDMEIEFPKRTDVLGRIAAQTAKQVIFQKVREAEREHIYAEYTDRVGEVINTMVKRFESGDLIVEIGRNEAVLPRKEQSRAESYTPGERIRAVIKGVNRGAKGPRSCCRAPTRRCSSSCSSRKCRRSTTAPWSSAAPCAKRAIAPRWPSTRASATWTRWAPASA
jgi:N utilization substance protein A